MDDQRAARISQLEHVPAFAELGEELKEAEARFWQRYVVRVKAGEEISLRELDFMRGKFEAIRVILNQPVRAARTMERIREAETEEVST